MAEVIHRYVGRGEQFIPAPRENDDTRIEKQRADLAYTKEKERAARSKRLESELRIAKAQRELISRPLAQRQAAFLVISLRQRLLALSSDLSHKIAETCDADERVIAALIDADMRAALAEFANLPERVTDPDWMQQLVEVDGDGATPAKRSTKRAAK